jgi:hypothetical protein
MLRAVEESLKVSLTETIDTWLEEVSGEHTMPYQGDNLAEIMASAALAVIRGMVDAEEYMQQNGIMKPT